MALVDDVLKVLVDTGKQLKNDLWTADDLNVLRQRAADLVGLNHKVSTATDPEKKAQYQLAAKLVVQHVQLLALTRLAVAQSHVVDALKNLITNTLLPALVRLLPAVLA
jgi:hypothetical protein